MTYGYDGVLKVESDAGVRIITLNDPDKLNAMTDPLHEALVDVWVRIMRDNDARVVVVTGAGRAFSAGGNIPGFIKNVEDLEYRRGGMRNARNADRPHPRLPPASDRRGERPRRGAWLLPRDVV
jgi:enoyl-CoA hydratase